MGAHIDPPKINTARPAQANAIAFKILINRLNFGVDPKMKSLGEDSGSTMA